MSAPSRPSGGDELDFTNEPPVPPPPPPPEQVERARAEAQEGLPQLVQSGFMVSIARRSPVRIPPRNGEKYALLVVEDDPDLAQLVIDIFMTAGFEMHWASNKSEINQQMNRRPSVDLVLMDIVLPDTNGLQVLQAHPVASQAREAPRDHDDGEVGGGGRGRGAHGGGGRLCLQALHDERAREGGEAGAGDRVGPLPAHARYSSALLVLAGLAGIDAARG